MLSGVVEALAVLAFSFDSVLFWPDASLQPSQPRRALSIHEAHAPVMCSAHRDMFVCFEPANHFAHLCSLYCQWDSGPFTGKVAFLSMGTLQPKGVIQGVGCKQLHCASG